MGKRSYVNRSLWVTLLLAPGLGFSGCASVYSEQPFHSDEDLVDKPKLEGVWIVEDGTDSEVESVEEAESESFEIKRVGTGTYLLVFTDPEDPVGPFEMPLWRFSIDGQQYADYLDEEGEMPLHNLVKLSWQEGEVSYQGLDAVALKEHLVSGEIALDHRPIEECCTDIYLTGTREELRRFLLSYGSRKELWQEDVSKIRRLSD